MFWGVPCFSISLRATFRDHVPIVYPSHPTPLPTHTQQHSSSEQCIGQTMIEQTSPPPHLEGAKNPVPPSSSKKSASTSCRGLSRVAC
jgi:hypothetical protein